jgi:hypothetical protein
VVPPGLSSDPLDQPNFTHDFGGSTRGGNYIISHVLGNGLLGQPSQIYFLTGQVRGEELNSVSNPSGLTSTQHQVVASVAGSLHMVFCLLC